MYNKNNNNKGTTIKQVMQNRLVINIYNKHITTTNRTLLA